MTRWMIAIGIGLLMLCEMLFAASPLFAQTPGGAFEQLSPGNQKHARALFEAQPSRLPPGTRPLTLDEIAARKQSGGGWGRVHSGMKAEGLTTTRNVGQAVSGYNHRHHVASAGTVTTAANRTVPHGNGVNAGRGAGPKASTGDHGRSAMSASKAPAHTDRIAPSGGATHGAGRGK